MNVLLTLLLAVQMLSALGMIGLILIQHGKGADMGAAFGSGGSGSLFGASGSANFLSRTTAVLAACSLSARWPWPTLAMCVPRAPAACWKALPSCCRRRPRSGAADSGKRWPLRQQPARTRAPASGAAQIPGK
jgi:preprotein translocase subunit SecG